MTRRALAHSRSGDKGKTAHISLIAHDPADDPRRERHVTAERVRAHFAGVVQGEVTRYALPRLGAPSFVMPGPWAAASPARWRSTPAARG